MITRWTSASLNRAIDTHARQCAECLVASDEYPVHPTDFLGLARQHARAYDRLRRAFLSSLLARRTA